MTWSRHSLRSEPMSRSAYGFCHGDLAAVTTSSMPRTSTARRIAARSGVEAVDVCRTHPPDVAVLDVFLGDSGGLGVADALRQTTPDLRVLFVTGLTPPSVCDALAPAPVLFKPVRRQQLLVVARRPYATSMTSLTVRSTAEGLELNRSTRSANKWSHARHPALTMTA